MTAAASRDGGGGRAWRKVAVLALPVLLAGALAVFPLHNDDAGFHIATGRWIAATGTIPATNPFTYAEDGATWVQHQWLPALAMAWLVDHGGVPALILAKAALVTWAFALAALAMAKLPGLLGLVLLTVGVAASAFRFYERPYLCSILALSITAAGLCAWQRGDTRGRWWALAAPVLAIHLHAGALDSVLLWLAFVAGRGLTHSLPLRAPVAAGGPSLRSVVLHALALAAALVAGLALLAPSGLAVLGLPFSFSSNSYWHAHLAEFRPLSWSPDAALQWPALLGAAAAAVLAVWRRRWFEALALAGFAALALRHVRMVWPMVVVALPLTAHLLAQEATWLSRLQRRGWQAGLTALALVLAGTAVYEQNQRFGLGLGSQGVNLDRHPLALLRLAATLPERAFVSDGLAGTWLWQNFQPASAHAPSPRHRVLVHNCLECYAESTYRDVYQRIRYGEPGWHKWVRDLGIRTFVLKHTTSGERRFQEGRPNVRQHLFADSAWVLVDFDDSASLYVARAFLPPSLATLDGFPVDPDNGRPRSGVAPAAIRVALARHAASHPRSVGSLDMLVRHSLRAGDRKQAAVALAEFERRRPGHPLLATLRSAYARAQ